MPNEGMGRVARFFLLGGQDSNSNSYNSNNNNQFGNNFGLGNKDTSNLLNLNLNSREIQEVDLLHIFVYRMNNKEAVNTLS